jgi:UDP-2,4-diacetamido-2,4,6-trideoxy-beta-L-altropyranose hydrolase
MIDQYFKVKFICRQLPDKIKRELEGIGFKVLLIEDEAVFLNQLLPSDTVVLDGYHFDADYQKKVKETNAILVCIDDLQQGEFFADLIINHAPVRARDYHCNSTTLFALGIEYALLRPVFLEQAKQARSIKSIETVLICFGGSDSKNLTAHSLRSVKLLSNIKKIYVITGAAYQYEESLELLIREDKRIEYFRAQTESQMVELMTKAELAIVSTSGILYEVIALGCKVIAGMYADNQALLYKRLLAIGAFEDAKNFETNELKAALDKVFASPMSPKKIIDGKSKERILQKFFEVCLSVRKVSEKDCSLLFIWANDKDVRSNAISKTAIEWADHLTWFSGKIDSEHSKMFILEFRGSPVGQIRYDRRDTYWLIDYSIDKNYRGRGFGKIMIRNTLSYLSPANVKALVMSNNVGSVKCFKSLFFEESEEQIIKGETFKVFEFSNEIHQN